MFVLTILQGHKKVRKAKKKEEIVNETTSSFSFNSLYVRRYDEQRERRLHWHVIKNVLRRCNHR